MYMQKDGTISRGMLGGNLATQKSPGQFLGSPCGGVIYTLNPVVVGSCFAVACLCAIVSMIL